MGRHTRTPLLSESVGRRLCFIAKVYLILILQLLLAFAFAFFAITFKPLYTFFNASKLGLLVYVVVALLTLAVIAPLYIYHDRHPFNFFFLGIFTLCFGFTIGLISAFANGKVVAEAVVVMTVVVIAVGVYTLWTVWKGQNFIFLCAFLISFIVIAGMFIPIQIWYPVGNETESVICVAVFSVIIVHYTYTLTERTSYNYIRDSVGLYIDIYTQGTSLLKFLKDQIKP